MLGLVGREPLVALTNIQVFIDLENVQPPHAEERARRRVSSLLSGIETYLEANGYRLQRVWGCARPRSPDKTRQVIDAVFAEFGAVMHWTKQVIADYEIRDEVQRRLQAGLLSPAILFISSDNDFSRILCDVRNAGIEVLVSGMNVGGQLQQSASRVISFSEFV